MRQFIRVSLALIALGIAASVHAQTLGTIAGSVKDATGAVLPGVALFGERRNANGMAKYRWERQLRASVAA